MSKLKYYLYISDAKVDMLFGQIPTSIRDRLATELTIDFKVITAKFAEDTLEKKRFSKARIVTSYIEKNEEIGTVDEPKSYFRATMPMVAGVLTPGMIYFGGRTERTLLALGGSEKHIIGQPNLIDIPGEVLKDPRNFSSFPVFIQQIEKLSEDLELDEDNITPYSEPTDDALVVALTRVNRSLRNPAQKIEFLAKRLWWKEEVHQPFIQELFSELGGRPSVLLGSPIYVALAE